MFQESFKIPKKEVHEQRMRTVHEIDTSKHEEHSAGDSRKERRDKYDRFVHLIW